MNKTIITKVKGDWQDIVDGCRATVAKPPLGKEPGSEFKRGILLAEHEPIREMWIKWQWKDIPYCIAMHWKTHIWPSRVNTSREDRTGIKRSERRQTDPIDFEGTMNLQHQIDTMRKRLCRQADPVTRQYAEDYKAAVHDIEPEASGVMVPNCVYRCGCPEMKMCEEKFWPSFVAWCGLYKKVDVQSASIRRRYDLYNEWFYECRNSEHKE